MLKDEQLKNIESLITFLERKESCCLEIFYMLSQSWFDIWRITIKTAI